MQIRTEPAKSHSNLSTAQKAALGQSRGKEEGQDKQRRPCVLGKLGSGWGRFAFVQMQSGYCWHPAENNPVGSSGRKVRFEDSI